MTKTTEQSALILNNVNWQNVRQNEPDAKVETTVKVIDSFIPKKTAAVEYLAQIKVSHTLAIGLVVSNFATAIGGALYQWAGAAMAGIFTMLAGWMLLNKIIPRMNEIKETYNLEK
jgi:hypothetical protein